MRLTLAQLNPVIGDIAGNLDKIKSVISSVSGATDLIVFSELCLTGYPPRDLLERRGFLDAIDEALEDLKTFSRSFSELAFIVGSPVREPRKPRLHNAAVMFSDGQIRFVQTKSLLPTYDVFDEVRYFKPGDQIGVIPFGSEVLGLSICEDAWYETDGTIGRYNIDPIRRLKELGATVLINISASPFYVGKADDRHALLRRHVQATGLPFIYVNQVGAHDELIFDGNSLALNKKGETIASLAAWTPETVTIDLFSAPVVPFVSPDPIASLYQALVLGVRDYMAKCGFRRVVLGLSGGIDSAVVACIAADAIGADHVLGVGMPSEFSSEGSVTDSEILAARLGIDFQLIPIVSIFETYLEALKKPFEGQPFGLAEENLQSRIRGGLLMALSNKFGYLLLSTGNKSEMAMGYCTLYGDMNGGLSVISDVLKTTVYDLAEYINRDKEIIPADILSKPPSAELRPDQKDQDSLPPYPVLDAILKAYMEDELTIDEIAAKGLDRETAVWVINTLYKQEYKRRQAAPGLKVSQKAFGMGRRMPIASRVPGVI